jgi:uncharacterized protein (DUF885 family)
VVEHDYAVYVLGRFPVVATYLGGAAFDAQLADVDGRLRDYSPEAIRAEDAQLGQFRARFAALAPAALSPRRRAQLELGTRYSPQRFHLELMKQGTIPPGYFGPELLRTLRAQ